MDDDRSCDDGFVVAQRRRLGGRLLTLTVLALVGLSTLVSLAEAKGPYISELHIDGVVDPLIASYVVRGIDDANDGDARAVLITIDTPGGLDSSMRKIVQSIRNSDVPVICFVSPQGARAASAGTFILLACPVAAMAPGTNVGAAHPVGVIGAIEQDKAVNDAVAYIRSLAEATGRNADWAEEAVRESVSVSANRAVGLKVADLIAADRSALLKAVNGRSVEAGGRAVTLRTTSVPTVERSLGWAAAIVHPLFSPNLAFIFFYLGLVLIVVELLHPGISVPGVLGVASMVTAFAGLGMLPIQLVGVVLLVASVVFFLLELKHPGIGVPTAGGLVTLVLGGLLLFNPAVPDARVSLWTITPVALAAAAFFAFAVNAALRLRGMPADTGGNRLIGQIGTAVTELAPSGVVHIASESWSADIAPEAEKIKRGARVRVVGVEGLRLKVEWEAPPEEPAKRKSPATTGGKRAPANAGDRRGGS